MGHRFQLLALHTVPSPRVSYVLEIESHLELCQVPSALERAPGFCQCEKRNRCRAGERCSLTPLPARQRGLFLSSSSPRLWELAQMKAGGLGTSEREGQIWPCSAMANKQCVLAAVWLHSSDCVSWAKEKMYGCFLSKMCVCVCASSVPSLGIYCTVLTSETHTFLSLPVQ